MTSASTVLVAIPVFNAGRSFERCLESVLTAAVAKAMRLLVIDDASDCDDIAALVRRVRERSSGRVPMQYRRNRNNRGFTANVNQAIAALRPDEHLVLLNSDTFVTDGWLDQMVATASSLCSAEAPIGTVTPFSNNATICSWPDFSRPWPMPSKHEANRIARLLASHPAPPIDIPTGVGFCMLITHACLEAVGPFDEIAFPRGYGEENDFCRRAAAHGFRNVLCPNAYVAHEGGVSFSSERDALMRQGEAALLAKHPDYLEHVREWVARDPAAPRRLWLGEQIARARGD